MASKVYEYIFQSVMMAASKGAWSKNHLNGGQCPESMGPGIFGDQDILWVHIICQAFISNISVSKISQITIINCRYTTDRFKRRSRRVNVLGQCVQECFHKKNSEGQWSMGPQTVWR